MQMSLNPCKPQAAARLMIRQGVICLRELATVEGIPFDEDPSPDTPSAVAPRTSRRPATSSHALATRWSEAINEAYLHFRGWRANYEAVAYELAARIDAVPAPWSGPRRPPLPVAYPKRPVNRTPDAGAAAS